MSPRRRVVVLLVCGMFTLGLAACSSPTDQDTRSATAGLPNLQQELAAQHWRLDASDSSITTAVDQRTTLDFRNDGTVSGHAPCNRYHGRYSTDLDSWTVTITDIAATKQACSASTMRAEREYLHALALVRDVNFSDGGFHVVLDNATGDRLSYDAYDTPHEP